MIILGNIVRIQQKDMALISFSGACSRRCCIHKAAQMAPRPRPKEQGTIIVGIAAFRSTDTRGFVGMMTVF